MRRTTLLQFKNGWVIGAFKPTLLPTAQFELAVKRHREGAREPAHYQRVAVEYNILLHGRLKIGTRHFREGDIFVIPAGEVTHPQFLTDCEVVCVKVPSLPGDKVCV